MVVQCDIKFDQNQHGVYFSGQILNGSVDISLDKIKKVNGVSLRIMGYAKCQFSESQGAGSNKRTVFFAGREDYINTTTYLAGSFDGEPIELLPGIHTYNFSCALSHILPTSFEGTYGHVRYTVKVTLERPWKFNQTYMVAFTVLRPLDLNFDSPILKVPCQMEKTTHYWCGPCSSDPLSIIARIPQSGFVPGQAIRIEAEVTNMSHVPVSEICFTLRKVIGYHSQTPSMHTKQEISKVVQKSAGGVQKNDCRRFETMLEIPPLPPSSLNMCKVITIQYEIVVKARANGVHGDTVICIPITLGTTPLNSHFSQEPTISTSTISQQPLQNYSMAMPYGNGSSEDYNNMPMSELPVYEKQEFRGDGVELPVVAPIANRAPPLPPYPDIPPPSYEESMYGSRPIVDEDDHHPIGKTSYAPRYPVYHFIDRTVCGVQQINGQPLPLAAAAAPPYVAIAGQLREN